MLPEPFKTQDGDVVLRAGVDPEDMHDFCVHKVVLSLASPVFRDMFQLANPSEQDGTTGLPLVPVFDPPHAINILLRCIYPGTEMPKTAKYEDLVHVTAAVRKYQIDTLQPWLDESLEWLISTNPFQGYVLACRFKLQYHAQLAARATAPHMLMNSDFEVELDELTSIQLLQLCRFVYKRMSRMSAKIKGVFKPRYPVSCDHYKTGKAFFTRLEEAMLAEFERRPCLSYQSLMQIPYDMPEAPLGCAPEDHPASDSEGGGGDDVRCPLAPTVIRARMDYALEQIELISSALMSEHISPLFQ